MSPILLTNIALIIFAFVLLRFVLFFFGENSQKTSKAILVQEIIDQANEMYAQEMYPELEKFLKIELARRPRNLELRKILVNSLLKLNKQASAAGHLETLSKISPRDMNVKGMLADCYAFLGRTKQAIVLAEELYRNDHKNPNIVKNLAELYYTAGQGKQALNSYQAFIDMGGNPDELSDIKHVLAKLQYESGDYEGALASLDALQASEPDNIDLLTMRMELTQRTQQWERCLEIAKKLIILQGESNEVLEKIAQMHFNLSHWDESLDYYKKLTKTEHADNSNYLHCQNRIAEIYINKGECEQAINILTRLIEKYPTEDSLAFTLAQAYIALNDYEQAVSLYENLIPTLPGDQLKIIKKHTSNLVVHWAESLFEQGEYSKAFDKYIQAIKYDEENPEVYYKFGVSNLKIKSINDAIGHFKRAITISPGESRFYYALGCASAEIGNSKGAQDAFENAITLEPENTKYMCALATTLAKQFINIEAGIELFKKIVKKTPDDPDALYNLALAYDMVDNRDEAIRYYKCAIEILPNHIEAIHNLSILLGYEYNAQEENA